MTSAACLLMALRNRSLRCFTASLLSLTTRSAFSLGELDGAKACVTSPSMDSVDSVDGADPVAGSVAVAAGA